MIPQPRETMCALCCESFQIFDAVCPACIRATADFKEPTKTVELPAKVASFDELRRKEERLGLSDRNALDLRIYWVNVLRKIVGRRIPKNKSGMPLVSDIDLLFATAEERQETFEKTQAWREKKK